MKKLFILTAAVLLLMSVCACSDKDNEKEQGGEDSNIKITVSSGESDTSKTPNLIKEINVLVVTEDEVNVRSEASTDAESLAVVNSNDCFVLIKENVKEGWHEIQYKEKSAYVSSDYSKVKTVTEEAANSMIKSK